MKNAEPVAYTSQRQLDLAATSPGKNVLMWGEPMLHHRDIPLYHHSEVDRLRADIKDREQAFEIHWNATRTATKLWQEQHPGQEGTWPDHANLCVWLMEQLEAIREELSDFVDTYDSGLETYAGAMLRDQLRHAQKPRTQQETSICSCSEDGHNCSEI